LVILVNSADSMEDYYNKLKEIAGKDVKPSTVLEFYGSTSNTKDTKSLKKIIKDKLVVALEKAISDFKLNVPQDDATKTIFTNIESDVASYKAATTVEDEATYSVKIIDNLKKLVELQNSNITEEQKRDLTNTINVFEEVLKTASKAIENNKSILDDLKNESKENRGKTITKLFQDTLVLGLENGITDLKTKITQDDTTKTVFADIDNALTSLKASTSQEDYKTYSEKIIEDLKKIVENQNPNSTEEQKKDLSNAITLIENTMKAAKQTYDDNKSILDDLNKDNKEADKTPNNIVTPVPRPGPKEDENGKIPNKDGEKSEDSIFGLVLIIILAAVIFILLVVLCMFSKRRVKNRDIEYVPQTNESMIRSSI